jgi:hypothetical protein
MKVNDLPAIVYAMVAKRGQFEDTILVEAEKASGNF